ncbi:hypothetical protein ACGFI9_36015 [Micromonospora sp. NPDC048930]|uniref:hypothetical protein n=1 Tax=Micromonospora sp. NPDC048930 TaxID=3364261 RepID=UPI00372066C2
MDTVTWPVAQLPAGSHDSSEVITWSAPSVGTFVEGGVVGLPDEGAGSTLDQMMVTGAWYQPCASGSRSGFPRTIGGRSSTRMLPVVRSKIRKRCLSPVI